MPSTSSTHLELALRRLNKSGRRSVLPSFGRMLPPMRIERDYQRILYRYTDKMYDIIYRDLVAQLPRIMGQLDTHRPEAVRQDAPSDDVTDALKRARLQLEQEYSDAEIRRIAAKKGLEVEKYNKEVYSRGLKRVTGVDVLAGEPWLADQLALFTSQNVNLITSMSEEYFNKVETIAFEGLKAGTRVEEIQKQITDLIDPQVGNIRARAELIARDQVGKLNGQLNYLRQSELGIKRYRWRTVGDERVRESHAAKEGNIYSWDDPPADTGHPGEDYQCRCQAEPVLEDLVPGMAPIEE